MNKSTMRLSAILTYAGLLPFLLLSIAVAMKINGYDYDLALRAYGAIIISFLCGIHWAIYLLSSDKCQRNLLIYSNALALVAYGSLLLSLHRVDLIVESLCLTFLLVLDYELMKQNIIPLWYFILRRNATIVVSGLLVSTACVS